MSYVNLNTTCVLLTQVIEINDVFITSIPHFFRKCYSFIFFFFFLPIPTVSGVGTTSFSSCCDKYWALILTTGRLPDVNPP
jgi:ABC-type dipeptide/oligopeptide/nickel transport system permease component